jgi:hypothetical protein
MVDVMVAYEVKVLRQGPVGDAVAYLTALDGRLLSERMKGELQTLTLADNRRVRGYLRGEGMFRISGHFV